MKYPFARKMCTGKQLMKETERVKYFVAEETVIESKNSSGDERLTQQIEKQNSQKASH